LLILSLLQAQTATGPNPFGTVFMFGAIFMIFYFLLIRPQRKQQKEHDEMVKSLSRGDEVVTVGGIIGKIVHLTDDRVTIKTAEDTRLEVQRSKVGGRAGGGAQSDS
jgi:preprotein translocase subunit YajC